MLTLKEGIELAWTVGSGMYPSETRHTREGRQLAVRTLRYLGSGITWEQLDGPRVDHLVRSLAAESTNGSGARTAIYMLDALYRTAAWLREHSMISRAAARPAHNWKVRLREQWTLIAGPAESPAVRPAPPKLTNEQYSAALRAADDRLFLFEILDGWRAPRSLMVAATRQGLDVQPDARSTLSLPSSPRKPGPVLLISSLLIDAVIDALENGYLATAEAAYRRGEIHDYYLFPSGRLRRHDRVSVAQATKQPIQPRTLEEMADRCRAIAISGSDTMMTCSATPS